MTTETVAAAPETEALAAPRTRSGTSRRPGQVRAEAWMSETLYTALNDHLKQIGMTRAEWMRQQAVATLMAVGKLPE